MSEAEWSCWPSPAKINLMLKVIGRRDDGYHLLQTVFQFLDLHDDIHFRPNFSDEICLQSPLEGVDMADNLLVKAARLLQQEASIDAGVEMRLDKRIPMGAGLGGGSSNAATGLLVLNRIWGAGFSTDQLAELGLSLGADVPVFVRGFAAWAEGVGEKLTPIELKPSWYLLLTGADAVSTAKVFSSFRLTKEQNSITMPDFFSGRVVENDLTEVVCRLSKSVREALTVLSRFGNARMTGSGSTVFVEFACFDEASEAAEKIDDRWFPVVTQGINRSLLIDKLDTI